MNHADDDVPAVTVTLLFDNGGTMEFPVRAGAAGGFSFELMD